MEDQLIDDMMLPTQTHSSASSSSSSSSKQAAKDDESALLDLLQKGKKNRQQPASGLEGAIFDVCLAVACLAGAALLAWWALAFHPSYARLWMVPVSLVLACTPVVVCAAVRFSPADDQPPLSAVVVVK